MMVRVTSVLNRAKRNVTYALVRLDLFRAHAVGDEEAAVDDLLDLGRLAGESGSHALAERYFRQANARARASGLKVALARSEVQLGSVSMLENKFEEARLALENALPILRLSAEPQVIADALLRLAAANDKLGNTDTAFSFLKQALEVAMTGGDNRRRLLALMDLGGIAYRQKRYEIADGYWSQALTLSRARHDKLLIAKVTFFLGIVALRQGEIQRARDLIAESGGVYEHLGLATEAARAKDYMSALETNSGVSSLRFE